MKELTAGEARSTLSPLMEEVSRGEYVMVTRFGRPLTLMAPPRDISTLREALTFAAENASTDGDAQRFRDALNALDG